MVQGEVGLQTLHPLKPGVAEALKGPLRVHAFAVVYSSLAPDALITAAHFGISDLI